MSFCPKILLPPAAQAITYFLYKMGSTDENGNSITTDFFSSWIVIISHAVDDATKVEFATELET